jgi:hypothetical protein
VILYLLSIRSRNFKLIYYCTPKQPNHISEGLKFKI